MLPWRVLSTPFQIVSSLRISGKKEIVYIFFNDESQISTLGLCSNGIILYFVCRKAASDSLVSYFKQRAVTKEKKFKNVTVETIRILEFNGKEK